MNFYGDSNAPALVVRPPQMRDKMATTRVCTPVRPRTNAISAPAQVSPIERAKNLRRLRCMTQRDYNHLLAIVVTVVGTKFCDPNDALGYGLLIALEKYDCAGSLSAYVVRCAYLYALQCVKKNRRLFNFCDLGTAEDLEDYLDSVAPYLDDPRYVEGVDELFVRRVEEILAGSYNWRIRCRNPRSINDATRILALYRVSANLGKGIGVDEYENGPRTALESGHPHKGRYMHNAKIVRRMILDSLADELRTDKRYIYNALKALRLSTLQALHEGWLPT